MIMTDKKLIEITTKFRTGVLNGASSRLMCAAVCWPLQGYLWALGMETEVVQGELADSNHIWLKLPDGRVLDPTADQFSTPAQPMPPVYLGPKPAWYLETG